MNRYEKYEDQVREISKYLPEIPKVITEEWLKQQLLDGEQLKGRRNFFRMWGFCFADLSDHEFADNIDARIIRKVPFSTRTIFPKKHPFHFNESIFHTFDDVRKLHDEKIDGRGINVAIIDLFFETIPNELQKSLYEMINIDPEAEVNMHGTIVATQLCGKNLGIAPKSKLWFYGTGGSRKHTVEETVLALKDIYEKNEKGANIKIISISASVHRENSEVEEIYDKLLEQGCYVIDSIIYGESFTPINQDPNTGELYYMDGQVLGEGADAIMSKIAIKTGGKMTPLVTTENDYMYCGQATYSWSIPILSGSFALALQINPDLTYDEFIELAKKTAQDENGIKVFNITGIINELKKEKTR